MLEFFKDGLHIFVVAMIFILGIGGMVIASGKYDTWGKRQNWKARKRKMDSH